MANVYHFGAVGDGKNDDTAALQHALEAGEGVLDLNKGTYRSRPSAGVFSVPSDSP